MGQFVDVYRQALGIKNIKEADGKTYYVIDNKGDIRTIAFDNVYSHWIRELFYLENILPKRDKRNISFTSNDDTEVHPLLHFFGLSESVCDQLMYQFAKDEFSESDGNRNLNYLCYHIKGQNDVCFDR